MRGAATLVLTALLLLGGCAPAEQPRIASAAPMNWNGRSSIELPLQLDSEGRPGIAVRIIGGDEMAVIDSGAATSGLEPGLAAALGAQLNGTARVNTISRQYETARGVPVQLGPGSIDLHSMIVGEIPGKVRLLLGEDLLGQAVVDIDFDARQVKLIRPHSFTPPAGVSLPVQFRGGVPTVQLQVNSRARPICAVLDTGFTGGVAVTPEMIDELGLPTLPNRLRTVEGFGGARHSAAALAPLESVRLGEQLYREIPVLEKGSVDGNACGNLLGMAVLSRHRLVFDLGNRRVWLLPRVATP